MDSERLQKAIENAAHLLPTQGPIGVFIHHNTLHAFEGMPFEKGVERAGRVFGCEPYLTEERYRDALNRGRIRFSELRSILVEELGDQSTDPIPPSGTLLELRLAMLQFALASGSPEELRWFVEETDALRRFRPAAPGTTRIRLIAETRRWVMRDLRRRNGASPAWVRDLFARFDDSKIENWGESTWEAFTLETIWRLCLLGVDRLPEPASPTTPFVRHRDMLKRAAGVDADWWVHSVLIRFCAAFIDQGLSRWPLPAREKGFLHAFCSLYRQAGGPPDRWLEGIREEVARIQDANIGALESIGESLAVLGLAPEEWDSYLTSTLLSLRGWGGMILQIEDRPDRVANPVPRGSLTEFLAVRLLLDRLALAHIGREVLDYEGPLSGLREFLCRHLPPTAPQSVEQRAFPIFQLAQVLGWTPDELAQLSPGQWETLLHEIEQFDETNRRRVFHLAYERRFYHQTLDALALHKRRKPVSPRFQLMTCLDEREESFRRHLEEIAPDCETFSAAGFYAIPMYYRGATDAHFVPLCPIVITPQHWVEEQAEDEGIGAHQRLRRTHRVIGSAALGAHVGSRSVALGAVITSTLGILASVPLVARVLFPRLTARVRRTFGHVVGRQPRTRIKLSRPPECSPIEQKQKRGFTLEEMVDMAERLLRDVGLIDGFSRLVFTLGHGSFSLNNPHKSAYDCGACGGTPGAPNGRAAAELINDRRVRAGLRAKGIHIPETTWFVGGFHNTCDDSTTFFDLDRIPESHRAEFERVREEIDRACERNAHERCRRFLSAPLTMTFAEAKQHVEGRSEDLAQTRPELGHATNAICHVGRRERTRGLYFDRRNFLTSYDPSQDDENGTILGRTMAAIFPVCGGINLEYFFCHVDSAGYGCATKLPHNITALLGVMDGAASDLRTGLPWQMTELHEPLRLLIVCETTPAIMMKVLNGNPAGKTMTDNGWVQLAVQCPHTNEIWLYSKGEFKRYQPQSDRLPTAATSTDWYRGWRDHLEFAIIG